MSHLDKIIESSINHCHTNGEQGGRAEIEKVTKHKIFLLVFVLAMVVMAWASIAQLDITVSTRGEILLATDVEKVQHLEGGILNELYISPGDLVYKGQKIAALSSQDRISELNTTLLEIVDLELTLLKNKALINNKKPSFVGFSGYPELVQHHQQAWLEEVQKNTSNDQLVKHDIKHKNSLIGSMTQRIKSSNKQLALVSEQLTVKQKLYNEEMASYVDVLNMKVQRMNMVREIENLDEATLNESYELIRLEKSLIDNRQSRNSEYQRLNTDVNKRLRVKQTQLPTIRDKVERLLVYSPVDGTVDKVHYNYISAVIAPGDSIADITPLNNTLHGEIKIPRKDVGFIEKGQAVKLKFDSYNFSKYGVVEGVISSISRSSYEDEDAQYYVAKVIMDNAYLDKGGKKYYLTPYMEFTADIKTGSRKVIDYALKPVITALDESFDER